MMPRRSVSKIQLLKIEENRSCAQFDHIAVEEPLEIRLRFFDPESATTIEERLSITMRTPGDDFDLAAGFLFTEGIIESREAIQQISYCVGADKFKQEYNTVTVALEPHKRVNIQRLKRHFYVTSSCGVCGKASLEALAIQGCKRFSDSLSMSAAQIASMPALLNASQKIFEKTGGLHAAALYDSHAKLISLREDVGRHNALDKLIGEAVLAEKTPLYSSAVLVSGRTSFELVQKALIAGIPLIAAIGAPSSLAVDLAKEFNMTLIGFVRGKQFNIYSGAHRISIAAPALIPIATSA